VTALQQLTAALRNPKPAIVAAQGMNSVAQLERGGHGWREINHGKGDEDNSPITSYDADYP
jgi:hypothetical protein